LFLCCCFLAPVLAASTPAALQLVLLGTNTTTGGEGIVGIHIDTITGQASSSVLVNNLETVNPSFFAFDPTFSFLYVTLEDSSEISAFTFPSMLLINELDTGDDLPLSAAVHPTGSYLIVTHYGGNVTVISLRSDGGLKAIVQSLGISAAARPHSAVFDSTGGFLLVSYWALNVVQVYAFNASTGLLQANNWCTNGSSVSLPAGSGLSRIEFSTAASAQIVFVLAEQSNNLHVLGWQPKTGCISLLQSISTLPANTPNTSYAADFVQTSNGKNLFVANRGADIFAIYSLSGVTLSVVTFYASQGVGTRSVALDPTEKFLLAANEISNSLSVVNVTDPSVPSLSSGVLISSPLSLRSTPILFAAATAWPTWKYIAAFGVPLLLLLSLALGIFLFGVRSRRSSEYAQLPH